MVYKVSKAKDQGEVEVWDVRGRRCGDFGGVDTRSGEACTRFASVKFDGHCTYQHHLLYKEGKLLDSPGDFRVAGWEERYNYCCMMMKYSLKVRSRSSPN